MTRLLGHFKLDKKVTDNNLQKPLDDVPVASVWIPNNEKEGSEKRQNRLVEIDAFLGMYRDCKTFEPNLSLAGNPHGRIHHQKSLVTGSNRSTTEITLPL
eukprot:CAMPEP_0168539286 /NCGR_PEP_ID=MMETSP0405-20121227/21732_1 /TAXON_ID=498012 /ORGANISM="Trichosphaerium sp, Strain Am-I-7 wt" /LENGTH=99 /DNA_ID=CAMNT_0008568809 /DNA_START=500 /DNA_END=796 /DNA_ORIENTATION=+